MKSVDKKNIKQQKLKKKPMVKPKKEKVLVVAQEFKFALLLSGNDKKTRDRVLKSLKKWLTNCFDKNYAFKEDDFIRVWKGLFYAMWMSDKPLVQEDLCESIANTLDLFPNDQFKYAVLMTKAGFKVLALEWYGLDQHRYDKFLMLVRRYLRGSFRCLQRMEWDVDSCKLYADMLSNDDGLLSRKTPHYARNASSLIQHLTECYLEELSKVSKGKIPEESLVELLEPFLLQVCGDNLTLSISSRQLLNDLMKQSEPGLKYTSAFEAWRQMGCPAGGPEALELQSDDENGEDEVEVENMSTALDPRAGHVDVVLTPLPVPARLLAARIKELMSSASSSSYKRARQCLQRFEDLSRDKYPLAVRTWDAEGVESPLRAKDKLEAIQSLNTLEKKLVVDSDELAMRGLRRKHRKRLLAKSRAGLSIVEDLQTDTKTDSNTEVKKKRKRAKKRKGDSEKVDVVVKKPKINVKQNNTEKKEVNSKMKRIEPTVEKTSKTDDRKTKCDKSKKISSVIVGKNKQTKSVVNNNTETIKKDKIVKERNSVSDKSKVVDKDKSKDNSTKSEMVKKDTLRKVNKCITKNVGGKVKNYQKKLTDSMSTPKKVKFVLKNNCMQGTGDYYKSVRQSPNIPYDGTKIPSKTNLKPSTPSPINPFFKKKLRVRS
ncbi:ribosomal RNA processing protein 1 homolog [Leptidea sinapis]|uniref:ribosomal RNA processing protein 1 homolog n=1 Tax=Leptidea sinapis TaxID=189913 RepID=UPI00213810BB|nr:ribosomal RNA processing protein 1 homolog [Leptidea sinapis]